MALQQRSAGWQTVLEQRDWACRPSGVGSSKRRASPCGDGFRASAQTAPQFAVPGACNGWPPNSRQPGRPRPCRVCA